MTKLKLIGITIPIVIFTACLSMYCWNPLSFQLLSLGTLNIIGVGNRLLINFGFYFIPGCLILLFGLILNKYFPRKSTSFYGSIFISLSGLLWIFLGLIPLADPNTQVFESSYYIHSFHLVALYLLIILGLFLLPIDLSKITRQKFLKWFTWGILIILLAQLIYSSGRSFTNIESNITWLLFFSWFGIFGFLLKRPGR